jgi:hypothetical protein
VLNNSGKFRLHITLLGEDIDISEDLCYQLLSVELKTSRFALQVDEATGVVKGAHLIMYVQYVVDMIHRRNVCFGNLLMVELVTSLEVFSTINHFLEENEINWENFMDSVLIEPSWCMDEMQDFTDTGKEESPSYYVDTLYASQMGVCI